MPRPNRVSGALALCLGLWAGTASAMPPEYHYTLRIPAPASHRVEVEARLPAPADGSGLELMMATWTPGSYLIREYARHVERVEAEGPDGSPLAVRKTTKNRWRIDPSPGPITLRYALYAHEVTVRTNFVTDDFALLNGAAIFIVPADENGPLPGSFEIRLEAPEAWGTLVTALAPGTEDPGHAFTASDYDTLVDSPVYVGTGRVYDFPVDGVPHRLLHHGGEGVWDDERSVADVRKIVEVQRDFWGSLPYEHYDFINLIVEAGGGLEHANSTVLMTSRWRTSTRKGYLGWLGLVSHELFHAWNVKRLHPSELSRFAYEREVYSRNLWIAEGITSYYDDLLLHRAGLITRDEYLGELSQSIARLQETPGRLAQSVELASFDAWIKAYRPDENTADTTVSYYTKGAVVAFLLDAEIRRASGGERTLGDALRTAWGRFGPPGGSAGGEGDRGFDKDDLLAVLEETADADLAALLDPALAGVEELDYEPALEWLGLRFAGREDEEDASEESEREEDEGEDEEDEKDEDDAPRAWLGASTSVDDGRLMVTRVPRDTPAAAAGLSPGDEILAIGGYRVPPRDLDGRLGMFEADQESTLLVSRRERLLELPVTFGQKPDESWKLEIDPDASEEQAAHRKAWLGTPGD
jgi:predicted metalloprotease with PDZ domain